MVKIFVDGGEREYVLEAEEGESLYRVLADNGLMEGPCGGKGICGKCGVIADGEPVLSCEYILRQDVQVELPAKAETGDIVAEGFSREFSLDPEPEGVCGLAVDIGTTTVVAALVDLHTGEELGVLSCLNSQKIFGQDVISRIHYASEHGKAQAMMQERIGSDIRTLTEGLLQKTGRQAEDIRRIVIGANTTMVHLFAGIDASSMGRSPYTPAFTGPLRKTASELSLIAAPEAEVYCIPAVSAFVGGDITAGVLACGLKERSGSLLFLDIGTNGELVLKKDGELFCCSCAAGPALEGMNISCGMRAAEGAVEDVKAEADGSLTYQTIGGKPAAGMCGSGILAAVAELRRIGVIGKSGRIKLGPLVKEIDEKRGVEIDGTAGIALTQQDVRQIQLAKGAILSGIKTLLAAAQIREEDLDRVLVAGQFGAHLKPESLTGSGILPECWTDRIEYVGNTSKSGARMCLLSSEERGNAERLAGQMKYIELSELKGYSDLFVQCLNF